jgi:hypothetical protein
MSHLTDDDDEFLYGTSEEVNKTTNTLDTKNGKKKKKKK